MAGILFLCLALLSSPAPFSLLFAIILHESAHIIAARLLGFCPASLTLTAGGIKLSFHKERGLFPSLAVLFAGCLAGALFSLLPFLPLYFRLYSAGLSTVNLLPISCLDGGGILLLLLERFMLPDRAYRIARGVSVAFVLMLWAISCAVQLKAGANLSLLAVSLYLTITALGEKGPRSG